MVASDSRSALTPPTNVYPSLSVLLRMKFRLLLFLSLLLQEARAGDTLRVFFVGNSYTAYNNLPKMIADLAQSNGDVLIYGSSNPGGYTWQGHCSYAPTLSGLQQPGWQAVVLQEQSQLPAFPDAQVTTDVLPFARRLDSLIKVSNPCARTVFYNTWGRKNGDASNCPNFPPLCTYTGMDSLLQLRYRLMADSFNAWLSPVASVWRRLRLQAPTINLYDADESHPSLEGSYAAACTFYALLFGKNPLGLPYNAGLSAGTTASIQTAAKAVAFDSLAYWRGFAPAAPQPNFSFSVNHATRTVSCVYNGSLPVDSLIWEFGDGSFSYQTNPVKTYSSAGTKTICVTAKRGCWSGKLCKTIAALDVADGRPEVEWTLFPNPAGDRVSVHGLLHTRPYRILTLEGVLAAQGISNGPEILLGSLPAGNYVLQVQDGTGLWRMLRLVRQ
jgi:hypothetical protein